MELHQRCILRGGFTVRCLRYSAHLRIYKKKPPQWLLFTTSPTGFSLFIKLKGADRTWTCIVLDKALIYLVLVLYHWTTAPYGAGRGNRTLKFSLEGWCFTIKLYLHLVCTLGIEPRAYRLKVGYSTNWVMCTFNKTYVFPALVEKHLKTPLRYVESHANFSFFILDKSWCPVQNKVHLHYPYINSANSPFRVLTLILFG